MTTRKPWLIAGLIVSLLALFGRGCSSVEDKPVDTGSLTKLPEPEQALGEHLMVALGQAKNFHHKADVYVSEGKIAEAATTVQQILSIDFPADAPEAEDVLLDARARLGKLNILQGRLDEAWAVLDQGVQSTKRISFFLANVHTVRAEVLEARAALVADTDEQAATSLKKQAIVELDRSIAINNELLSRLAPVERK